MRTRRSGAGQGRGAGQCRGAGLRTVTVAERRKRRHTSDDSCTAVRCAQPMLTVTLQHAIRHAPRAILHTRCIRHHAQLANMPHGRQAQLARRAIPAAMRPCTMQCNRRRLAAQCTGTSAPKALRRCAVRIAALRCAALHCAALHAGAASAYRNVSAACESHSFGCRTFRRVAAVDTRRYVDSECGATDADEVRCSGRCGDRADIVG
jgi:hypothetical protein